MPLCISLADWLTGSLQTEVPLKQRLEAVMSKPLLGVLLMEVA